MSFGNLQVIWKLSYFRTAQKKWVVFIKYLIFFKSSKLGISSYERPPKVA